MSIDKVDYYVNGVQIATHPVITLPANLSKF